MQIQVIHHASIKLTGDKIIYFDPYRIEEEWHDADYIFVTHDHYDHYDSDSIQKIFKEDTKLIVPRTLEEIPSYLVVEPYRQYEVDDLVFDVIPAYNTESSYHPKEKDYVGYHLFYEGESYYVMGDTSRTEEADSIQSDYCFVPVGGVYTMDLEEAVSYIRTVKPKVSIPIHYGEIVGDLSLGEEFRKRVEDITEVKVYMREDEKND